MRRPSPPIRLAAVAVLLACAGCGSLDANQGDVVGGSGQIVAVGGSSGGGQSGSLDGGGARPGSGGSGGAACLPPGASAACSACEATKCTTNAFIYGDGYDAATFDPGDPQTPAGGIDWYHLCYDATGAVAAGPMKGVKKSVLCPEIVDCVHRSGCNAANNGNLACYCGAGVTIDECSAGGFVPQGPCADLIAGGAESNQALTVGNRAIDPAYVAGAALGLIALCDYPVVNGFGSTPGTCQTECLGGGDGGTTSCTTAPTDGGAPGDGGGSRPDAGGRAGAGGSGGAGGAGGSGGGCATTYSFADSAACASCEIESASTDPAYCDPVLLTAQVTQDSNGDLVAMGFGPDTLSTAAQRDAAFGIIHRVVELKCSSDEGLHYRAANMPGCETLPLHACNWPSIGCLLDLGQQPTDLLSGTFATMPTYSALAEYEAAAIADATAGPATPDQSPAYGAPGGLSVGASNAALGKYISDQGYHPSSAIGIADRVLSCAINAGCTACFNLTTTTSCPSGVAGSNGAAGAAGAAGSNGAAGGAPLGRRAWRARAAAGGSTGATGTGGSGSSGGKRRPRRDGWSERRQLPRSRRGCRSRLPRDAGSKSWVGQRDDRLEGRAGKHCQLDLAGRPRKLGLGRGRGRQQRHQRRRRAVRNDGGRCIPVSDGHARLLLPGRRADLDPFGPGERGGGLRAGRAHHRRLQPADRPQLPFAADLEHRRLADDRGNDDAHPSGDRVGCGPAGGGEAGGAVVGGGAVRQRPGSRHHLRISVST